MADVKEKVYQVKDGCKYTGKHGVYIGKNESVGKLVGDKFVESELFGDTEMALKGSDKHKIKPVIEIYKASSKK